MIQLRVSRVRNYVLTVIAAVILVFGFAFGLTMIKNAQAFSGSGSGTSGSPFLIANCVQLQEMQDDLAASYRLANDIDCSDTVNWNGGKGFSPVGDGSSGPFTGSLDGNGHTIDNLSIIRADDDSSTVDNASSQEFVGLFGYTFSATVQKVHLSHAKIKGYRVVGGIAGRMQGGTLSDSSVNLTTDQNDCTAAVADGGQCVWARYGQYVGGLIGYLTGTGTVTNSQVGGVVKGNDVVGGLVGYMTGTSSLEDSASTASVSGATYVGGAIGFIAVSGVTVQNVSASGDVAALVADGIGSDLGSYAGGFVGQIADAATITGSYAKGTVHGDTDYVGGFVGSADLAQIHHSYATGEVSSGNNNAGGFAGALNGGQYYADYATGSVSAGNDYSGGFSGSVSLGSSEVFAYLFSLGSVTGGTHSAGLVGAFDQSGAVVDGLYFNPTTAGTSVCAVSSTTGNPVVLSACHTKTDMTYFYDENVEPFVHNAVWVFQPDIWYFSGSNLPILLRELTGPIISKPTTGQFFKSTMPLRLSFPTDSLSGSVRLTFSNTDRTIVITLQNLGTNTYPYEAFNIDDLLSNDPVVSVSPSVNAIPDGTYDITISYQRPDASPAQSDTVQNVTISHSPIMLCEEAFATDTTISSACSYVPDEFGTANWQVRYAVAGTANYTYVTLGNAHEGRSTITGLTPGTEYWVEYQFTNDWGTGQWGRIIVQTTGVRPIAQIVSNQPASTPTTPSETLVKIADTTPETNQTGNGSLSNTEATEQKQKEAGLSPLVWILPGAALALIIISLVIYNRVKTVRP